MGRNKCWTNFHQRTILKLGLLKGLRTFPLSINIDSITEEHAAANYFLICLKFQMKDKMINMPWRYVNAHVRSSIAKIIKLGLEYVVKMINIHNILICLLDVC